MLLADMLKVFVISSVIQIIYGRPNHGVLPFEYASQLDSPWLAYIIIKQLERCGGSLINKKFVLTAAHCFDTLEDLGVPVANDVKIYFGEWKLGQDPDCTEENDDEVCIRVAQIPPAKLYIHEEYDKDAGNARHKYDIALLTLKRPPKETEIVSSIRLPSADLCASNFAGVAMSVAGFGEKSHKVYTDMKKNMTLRILDTEACKAGNRKFKEAFHFCGTGPKGVATCKGDSGGGVVLNEIIDDESVPVLQGIVSYGASECGMSVPSGFLKVSCFLDWIHWKMDGKKPPKHTKKADTEKLPETTTVSTTTTTERVPRILDITEETASTTTRAISSSTAAVNSNEWDID